MTDIRLTTLLNSIQPTDKSFFVAAQKNWDALAHPPGSLGELELMVCKLAAIQKTIHPSVEKKCVCVFASDNGVFAEGITSQPQETTVYLAEAMLLGNTGLGALSKVSHSDIKVYDAGLIRTSTKKEIQSIKLAYGTGNIAIEQAMTYDKCIELILRGAEVAKTVVSENYTFLGTGELGICNTTTTAAVLSAISQRPANETVGSGASATPDMQKKKREVVEKALKLHKPNSSDPIDCIAKVGGFDIAAMCGFFLGAACSGVGVVIDGFISSVAALCAARLQPNVTDYLFASHASSEKGAHIASELLGLHPVLHLHLRLGEGSGCPLFFSLMDTAIFISNTMAHFSDTPIDRNDLVDLRK
ncbi:MAG: nicotinate-nucleotide--dimethylbenzimidazole phosphoribosyltransferase [Spirochaetaceae bacterium]|nr:nicotinate-nucleotide--dimethylbenzimidazole phosphoribosyltransferase [Spirochaetaceae bacterium]